MFVECLDIKSKNKTIFLWSLSWINKIINTIPVNGAIKKLGIKACKKINNKIPIKNKIPLYLSVCR